MEIDRKELKRRAREAMGLARPRFWVVALVYFLMTTGLSYLTDWLVPLLAHGEAAFTLSDLFNCLMALPNLVCLLLLSGAAVEEMKVFEPELHRKGRK